jgi:hypothetical protein
MYVVADRVSSGDPEHAKSPKLNSPLVSSTRLPKTIGIFSFLLPQPTQAKKLSDTGKAEWQQKNGGHPQRNP